MPNGTNLQSLPPVNDGQFDGVLHHFSGSFCFICLRNLRGLVFLADGANLLRPNGFLQWRVSFKHVMCHTIDYVTGIGSTRMRNAATHCYRYQPSNG
jgi:hypothetical protein